MQHHTESALMKRERCEICKIKNSYTLLHSVHYIRNVLVGSLLFQQETVAHRECFVMNTMVCFTES